MTTRPHTLPRRLLLFCGSFGALVLASCQHPAKTVPPASTAARPAISPAAASPEAPANAYLFGWGELATPISQPRGGTTRGAPVTLAPARPLPLPEIAAAPDAFTRDRAAILALAGDYKVSFHFLETLGLTPDHTPPRPYHSWATEHVRVIEDTGRFISLQHTLVMSFQNEYGTVSEPMLTKHWRQDWTYEPAELHTFRGVSTWARRRLSSAESAGAWSQAVYQVDDSPRYAALGRWTHEGNRSLWTGENAWRPLPRREHTVRKDYDVMEGFHRVVLTPTGWVHEQLNWKRVAGDSVPAEHPPAFVAEEWGVDRYERITAPTLAAADEYWKKTGSYWAAVRRAWAAVLGRHDRFTLRREASGKRLFEEHFAYAQKLADGAPLDPADAERHAHETIAAFVEVQPSNPTP